MRLYQRTVRKPGISYSRQLSGKQEQPRNAAEAAAQEKPSASEARAKRGSEKEAAGGRDEGSGPQREHQGRQDEPGVEKIDMSHGFAPGGPA